MNNAWKIVSTTVLVWTHESPTRVFYLATRPQASSCYNVSLVCFIWKVIKFKSHLHYWYKAYDGRWVGKSTIEQVSIEVLNCNKRFESFRVKFEMKKGSISNQIQSHLPMWSFLVKSPKVKLYLFYFCKPFLQKLFIRKGTWSNFQWFNWIKNGLKCFK